MEISVSKFDGIAAVKVDGKQLDGLKDYKITSLASGETRLVLNIFFTSFPA